MHGYHRQPGAKMTIYPVRLPDGRYLTGLDENAPQVLGIPADGDREAEQNRIVELRKRLEQASGLELGPRSFYYSKISQADPQSGIYTDERHGVSTKVATPTHLIDGENVFNFADPIQEITFLWTALHPAVAPSLELWKKGKLKNSSNIQFYVFDPGREAAIQYEENSAIVNATASLKSLPPDKRKKIAKLIGLLVSENDTDEIVFNELYKFISSGIVKMGDFKGYKAVALFNQMVALKDNMLTTKSLIKDAIALGVYRSKSKAIFEGEFQIAADQDELLKRLMSAAGQEDYIALEEKINNKKGITK